MDHSQKKTRSRLILGTGAFLILVFLSVIALFMVFSAFSNDIVGKCIAVVDINNPLTVEGVPPSLFDSGLPSSEDYASTIRELNSRDDVGAVVFVMNSPGGSVVATREVYDAVVDLDKPSVSYFREVAASGAYYVASGTDYIVSDPNALTGSIGVIATFTSMEGLFGKLGIETTTIKSGQYKDIGSAFRNMTDDEKQIMQALVDEVYQEFRSVVLSNRKDVLDRDRFDAVADGRILSGRQAKAVGLVDQLGNKRDAIKKAAELANISASYNDLRICEVNMGSSDGSLFSADAMVRALLTQDDAPSISYR